MQNKIYSTTKEQCEKTIYGVCSGCGGKLEPMETVDNSGNPTFWGGCNVCGCFDWGVDRKVFEIAELMVKNYYHVQYSHMQRPNENDSTYSYWLSSQIRGTSGLVNLILRLNDAITSKANPAGGQPASTNMLHDPNTKQEEQESAGAAEQAEATNEANEAADTPPPGDAEQE